jgi:hypothetical protein
MLRGTTEYCLLVLTVVVPGTSCAPQSQHHRRRWPRLAGGPTGHFEPSSGDSSRQGMDALSLGKAKPLSLLVAVLYSSS